MNTTTEAIASQLVIAYPDAFGNWKDDEKVKFQLDMVADIVANDTAVEWIDEDGLFTDKLDTAIAVLL